MLGFRGNAALEHHSNETDHCQERGHWRALTHKKKLNLLKNHLRCLIEYMAHLPLHHRNRGQYPLEIIELASCWQPFF